MVDNSGRLVFVDDDSELAGAELQRLKRGMRQYIRSVFFCRCEVVHGSNEHIRIWML